MDLDGDEALLRDRLVRLGVVHGLDPVQLEDDSPAVGPDLVVVQSSATAPPPLRRPLPDLVGATRHGYSPIAGPDIGLVPIISWWLGLHSPGSGRQF
jgi:hypothetical protein